MIENGLLHSKCFHQCIFRKCLISAIAYDIYNLYQHQYLSVKVDESLRTVDVVEGCKTGHGAVYGHGVGPKLAPPC